VQNGANVVIVFIEHDYNGRVCPRGYARIHV